MQAIPAQVIFAKNRALAWRQGSGGSALLHEMETALRLRHSWYTWWVQLARYSSLPEHATRLTTALAPEPAGLGTTLPPDRPSSAQATLASRLVKEESRQMVPVRLLPFSSGGMSRATSRVPSVAPFQEFTSEKEGTAP
jgi:hypothetical protein